MTDAHYHRGEETLLSVGSEQGKLFLFKDLEVYADATFTDVTEHWDEYVSDFENRFGMRSSSSIADLDDDGSLEMVVGNICGGLELLNGDIAVHHDVEENGPSTSSGALAVYPNPANGCVTVEGKGLLTVMNLLGQTIFYREIDGKTSFNLPSGLWLVRLNGITRKVVVE